jgi:hypothetical protein
MSELRYRDLKTPLMGLYQRKNTQTVLASVEQLRKQGYGTFLTASMCIGVLKM